MYDFESTLGDKAGDTASFSHKPFRTDSITYIVIARLLDLVSLAIDRLNSSDIEPPKVPQEFVELKWLYRRFPLLYRVARQKDMWRYDLDLPYCDYTQRFDWRGPPFVKEGYNRHQEHSSDFPTMLGAVAYHKRAMDSNFATTPSVCSSLIAEDCASGPKPQDQHASPRAYSHNTSHTALQMPFEVLWEEPLNNSVVGRSQVTFEIRRFKERIPAGSRHVATLTIGSRTQPLQNWDVLEEIITPGHSLRISIPLDPMALHRRQFASVSIADETSTCLHHFEMGLDGASVHDELLPSVYTSALTMFTVESRKVIGNLNAPIHNESYSLPILPIHLSITGLVSTDTVVIRIDDAIVDVDSLRPYELSDSGTRTLHSGVHLAEYALGLHIFRAEVFDLTSKRVMATEALFYKMPPSPKSSASVAAYTYSTNRIIGDFGDTFRFDGACLTSDLELLYFAGGDAVYDFPPLAPEESLSLEFSCKTNRQWAPVVVSRNLAPLSRPAWPSPRTLVMLRPSVWLHGHSMGRLIVSDLLGLFSVMRDLHEDSVDVLLIDTFPGQTESPPEVAENFALFHAAGGDVWLLSTIWENFGAPTTVRRGGLLCPGTLVPLLRPLPSVNHPCVCNCRCTCGIHRLLGFRVAGSTVPTKRAE